jgi:hypothetical protein
MGTKTNPGKFDCYENAAPDEPMFVLLARDPQAPALVWRWARVRALRGESKEKVQEAMRCADEVAPVTMAAWEGPAKSEPRPPIYPAEWLTE